MDQIDLDALTAFVVRAKAAAYAGEGPQLLSYRLGSHDLQFRDGRWAYHDSYFGGTDFLGQEIVYRDDMPVWGQNYFGRILRDDLLNGDEAGRMIKASLASEYSGGRFLGGFTYEDGELRYVDTSEGDAAAFTGLEWIERGGTRAYELHYHGGLIRR